MKYLKWLTIALAVYGLAIAACPAQDKAANRPPVIKHESVTTAVKGQSISIRAAVTDDTDSIKSVYLSYTTSKDAAPFKIALQSIGANSYFGSIPSSLLKGVSELSYYIEAVDDQDASSETRWYTVKIQASTPVAPQPDPSQPQALVQTPGQAQAAPVNPQVEPKKDGWSWRGPAIIAGSAAAVVGGALLAANSAKDDSDGAGGGGGTSVTNSGTYSGTATRYLQMTGGSTASESYPITITVTSSGNVRSDNLHPNTSMEAPLNASVFQMTTGVTQSNLTGQIIYTGTLLGNAISGSIAGAVTASTGTNGTYSGNFSATKQ